MNEQSGPFTNAGPVSPRAQSQHVAASGLRDMALATPVQPEAPKTINVGELWRVLRKWWWLIAAVVLTCMLLAAGISLLIEPQYRAETTLEINREGVQPIKMDELQPIQGQDADFINTQVGLLRSRGIAERVVRSLNLANNPSVVAPSVEGDRVAVATDNIENSIEVEPVKASRLVELKVESPDPVLAAKIANTYADVFMRASLERRFEANSYARNFLEQRIAAIRRRLEQSERQLVAYAQQQGIVALNTSGKDGDSGETSLEASSAISLNEALSQARAERIAAEQRYRRQASARADSDVIADPTVSALGQQRAQLQAEYQEKLGLFKPDYPAMVQLRNRISSLDAAIARQSAKVTSSASNNLRTEYAAAVARESALQGQVDRLKNSLLSLRARSINYTILQREVDTNRALYDALLQRYKEVGVAGGVGMNIISIVDRAEAPGAPFKPNLPINLVIGLSAGLILGLGSAFALEWMDDTIKTPDDLTTKLKIPALGIIPAAPKPGSIQEDLEDPRSQLSEAYQSVRTALQFSTQNGVPRSIFVTSTRAGEGKSTTSLAIANAIASSGASVLLIDADLRKPTFRSASSHANGLSSLLTGAGDLESSIQATSQDKLFLIPAGRIPPNPAELLAAGRFAAVLERVSSMFDHVVIDGPPVLGLADAPLLASECAGTLIVIEAGGIRRAAAQNSLNRLRGVDCTILGGILTKFSATKSGYGYGYGYGYGDDAYSYREGEKPKSQVQLLKSE